MTPQADRSRAIGLIACISIGVLLAVAETFWEWMPGPLIALAAGFLLARFGGATLRPGAGVASSGLLRAGVVLLGVRLSVGQVVDLGPDALIVMLSGALVGGSIAYVTSRAMGLDRRLRLLLAAGSAICGNTAIAVISPLIRATDEQTTKAIGAITLYGSAALFIFPVLIGLLDLSDRFAGIWIGSAVNDTSQVVAAAFSVSDGTGEVATVVKLFRNLLIVPLAVGLSWRGSDDASGGTRKGFPGFIAGFALMVVVASVFAIPEPVVSVGSHLSKICILAALTGIGVRASGMKWNTAVGASLSVGVLAGVGIAGTTVVLLYWLVGS